MKPQDVEDIINIILKNRKVGVRFPHDYSSYYDGYNLVVGIIGGTPNIDVSLSKSMDVVYLESLTLFFIKFFKIFNLNDEKKETFSNHTKDEITVTIKRLYFELHGNSDDFECFICDPDEINMCIKDHINVTVLTETSEEKIIECLKLMRKFVIWEQQNLSNY